MPTAVNTEISISVYIAIYITAYTAIYTIACIDISIAVHMVLSCKLI